MYEIQLTEGDILDRLSILFIKNEKDIEVTLTAFSKYIDANPTFDETDGFKELYDVNLLLWGIEDDIRLKHKELKEALQMGANDNKLHALTTEITNLSNQVIQNNARRAEIKREIDGADTEKKQYAGT